MAALSKMDYNGRFVKRKMYQEAGKEYSTIVQMGRLGRTSVQMVGSRSCFDSFFFSTAGLKQGEIMSNFCNFNSTHLRT